MVLKPIDKKVIEAFAQRKPLESNDALLSSDGKTLRKHGMGSEKVAVWLGPQISIVSTISAKSDEVILRYLTRVAKGLVTYEGLKIYSGGDALYKDQWDGWIEAYVPGVDKPVGRLDWREYMGKYSIKMVEVIPEYRRNGIATALYNKLFKENHITKRDLGPSLQTPDGAAFRQNLIAYTYGR
jgi:GNAT superfamily N-acetyltransferase